MHKFFDPIVYDIQVMLEGPKVRKNIMKIKRRHFHTQKNIEIKVLAN